MRGLLLAGHRAKDVETMLVDDYTVVMTEREVHMQRCRRIVTRAPRKTGRR